MKRLLKRVADCKHLLLLLEPLGIIPANKHFTKMSSDISHEPSEFIVLHLPLHTDNDDNDNNKHYKVTIICIINERRVTERKCPHVVTIM